MTLADERLKELDNPLLTVHERILLRCRIASDFIHNGQYETAREALGELWPSIGERPDVKKLPPVVAAEVLLQCGSLTGLLGLARNAFGMQERAKDCSLRQYASSSLKASMRRRPKHSAN
jgi:hypothetical protein